MFSVSLKIPVLSMVTLTELHTAKIQMVHPKHV